VLECLDVPIPEPKAHEISIRAHAIGVAMPDVVIRAGTYSFMLPLPATPGQSYGGRSWVNPPSGGPRREDYNALEEQAWPRHRGRILHHCSWSATQHHGAILAPIKPVT
jgi:hypothetical protein